MAGIWCGFAALQTQDAATATKPEQVRLFALGGMSPTIGLVSLKAPERSATVGCHPEQTIASSHQKKRDPKDLKPNDLV